ncbi:dihydropteroate synthase [Halodesulfovibrio marinisediminis]|uniref:Dihydropteroate synthase n=1 Tax=Halodesulfovibrio marinisediminis DSM 17456 TaxID=1121457 RepID=A0A1N6DEP4_9BACT|nr:dihydropteroate synthase [Halodesulfovibrio marinisediminis]SIN69280.1 Dihydropteroate synthase [Halodesulfovibrio marinisediminis DSM 17456]
MKTPFSWEVRGGRSLGPAPFCIFGIVNVTPDSFYDGGEYNSVAAGIAHARKQAAAGAHVLDIGGESSRPFADYVSLEEEIDRVLPIVEGVVGDCSDDELPWAVSVDTYKAGTAAAVLEAGAHIINDISAFEFEPELRDVVAQFKPGYVLMHSQGKPDKMQVAPAYDNVVDDILAFFERKLKELTDAGMPETRIMIDPGVGFGKTVEHNVTILQNIDRFQSLGFPVLAGISNKSMFEKLCGAPSGKRENCTQAATAILAYRGVEAHRVHDVAKTRETLLLAEALRS